VAADALSLSEGDFLGELPVVLSVSRLSQPTREAPAAVTVIDSDMIRASGARDIADLLRLVPGFQVTYGDVGAPLAVYHGYLTEEEPKRLQVLVDGRSQFSPVFTGAVNWNLVDVQLADIERIEVIRGTNSASYGSNAFLGVVNVITKNAAADTGVDVHIANGNQRVQDRSARAGMRVGDGYFRASAEQRFDAGLSSVGHDSRRTKRALLRLEYPLGISDSLEASLGQTVAEVGTPAAPASDLPERFREYSTQHAGMTWRHHFDGGAESQLRVLGVVDRIRDAELLEVPPVATFFDHDIKALRNEIEAQYVSPVAELRWVAGGSYRDDSTHSSQFFGDERKVRQTILRAFGTAEWQPVRWASLHAGATWEHDSISGPNVSPRATLSLLPTANHAFRLGAARGHRVPTLFEEFAREDYLNTAPGPVPVGALLDAQSRASGGLRPERIDSYELGYLYENPDERFALDLRAFNEYIDDGIIWFLQALPGGPPGSMDCQLIPDSGQACGTSRDFVNGAKLKISGVEYQAKWQPLDSTRITFNQALIDIDARYTRPDRSPLPSVQFQLDHLNRSAPKRATTIIIERELMPRLDLFLSWFHVGQQKSSPGAEAPEYRRLDWRLAYRFDWAGSRGELAYTVQADGRRHVERAGNALLIPNASQALIEQADWLYPRAWLSLRLEH
jgi:iron complex outermembrane receptor protein